MPRAEMDDYTALAQRISVSVHEVRGCLLLSRDGLTLGAYPDEEETLARSAWLRFSALGEPDRSFVEFPDQVWAFVKRSAYAAFAVADVGVRPGILVDQLEQMLLAAEEGRARRDTLRLPDANAAPSGKPRTSLHPAAGRPEPAEISAETVAAAPVPAHAEAGPTTSEPPAPPEPASHWKRSDAPIAAPADGSGLPPITAAELGAASGSAGHAPTEAPAEVVTPPSQASSGPTPPPTGSALGKEPKRLAGGAGGPSQDDGEVDRVLLAKEFSGLLQVDTADDEADS
jgi:hypothetical protein